MKRVATLRKTLKIIYNDVIQTLISEIHVNYLTKLQVDFYFIRFLVWNKSNIQRRKKAHQRNLLKITLLS